MKKYWIIGLLALSGILTTNAKVNNLALQLKSGASVDCGALTALNGTSSLTIQCYICPDEWTTDASVLTLGNIGGLKLGTPGQLKVTLGDKEFSVSDNALVPGSWSHIMIIVDNGEPKAFINGKSHTVPGVTIAPLAEMTDPMIIGGSFAGRIDEIRVWNDVLSSDYNYFINNTLNRWNPQLDNLVAYYKMDQAHCKDIVEMTAIWKGNDKGLNNHGIISGDASLVSAEDNLSLPYLINAGYTANERFWDRGIGAEQYIASNEIIILGIQSYSDGHLRYVTPTNHGTLEGDAKRIDKWEGRSGVLSLSGNGYLSCPVGTLDDHDVLKAFTIEMWLYIDEWKEGAYIFRKENADASKGLSIRLGSEDKHTVIVRCDGAEYVQYKRTAANPEVVPGKWIHFAVESGLASSGQTCFDFFVDGKMGNAIKAESSTEIHSYPTEVSDLGAKFGEGLSGKIDQIMIWHTRRGQNGVKDDADNVLMPGIGKKVTADVMFTTETCYLFDNAEQPGWDSWSQDEWLEIMKEPFKGTEGAEFRISVKSHNGWESTISNASRRKIFAEDLAKLSKGYDGVELDLEWMYGTQTYLGYLAQDIRAALPEGMSFNISCHNVAYGFPKDKMQYVDGFTFQQYGPQDVHSKYSHFESMCKTFVSYGFPKDKIIGSYATTTAEGVNSEGTHHAIVGVIDLIKDDFVPNDEIDYATDTFGFTYGFDGPTQVFKRANYIVQNNLGGIFYWDMGNDLPFDNKWNLAKWASYGLNSNIEPRITSVNVNHTSSISNVSGDAAAATLKAIDLGGGKYRLAGTGTADYATLTSVDGCSLRIAIEDGSVIDLSSLASGLYIVTVGNVSVKIIK